MSKRADLVSGKSKMTVLVFQLEGNDQTLQDGIRTISTAIDGMVKPIRALPSNNQTGLLPRDGNGTGTLADSEAEAAEQNELPLNEARPEARRYGPRAPRVLAELKVPVDELKKFCEEKAVGTMDSKRYLAISAFLKDKMGVTAVSMDHIHTCYRLLGWNTPRDAGSPLRGLKGQGMFEKGEELGTYVLNHVGENEVRDMGKTE